MGNTSTRLTIIFFGLLLAAFIVIQYGWLNTLLKDKQSTFRYLVIKGIRDAGLHVGSMDSMQLFNALR